MKKKRIISAVVLSAVAMCGIYFFRIFILGFSMDGKNIAYTMDDIKSL